jgi:hypothetical protein
MKKKNVVIAAICQQFADIVAGNSEYEDIYSLLAAIDAVNKIGGDSVCKEDLTGLLNPHTDMCVEMWEEIR